MNVASVYLKSITVKWGYVWGSGFFETKWTCHEIEELRMNQKHSQ